MDARRQSPLGPGNWDGVEALRKGAELRASSSAWAPPRLEVQARGRKGRWQQRDAAARRTLAAARESGPRNDPQGRPPALVAVRAASRGRVGRHWRPAFLRGSPKADRVPKAAPAAFPRLDSRVAARPFNGSVSFAPATFPLLASGIRPKRPTGWEITRRSAPSRDASVPSQFPDPGGGWPLVPVRTGLSAGGACRPSLSGGQAVEVPTGADDNCFRGSGRTGSSCGRNAPKQDGAWSAPVAWAGAAAARGSHESARPKPYRTRCRDRNRAARSPSLAGAGPRLQAAALQGHRFPGRRARPERP